MKKLGKRFMDAQRKVNFTKKYSVTEGIGLVLETAGAKFDESIDVSVGLGVDPKQSDQQVRGAVALPHGLGKKIRVVAFAKASKEKEAKEAGACFVGSDDLVEKIKEGWLDFDRAIATPDMMATVAKVARILGPRGLMPNPKMGTVTMNVADAVSKEMKGKLNFRVEKGGIIHASVGRKSMGVEKIKDNYLALIGALQKAKPSSSKGVYMKNISISATMGPSVCMDVAQTQAELV